MPSKRHKPEEIVTKLRQVDVLISQGKTQTDAIRAIGVAYVTYARWKQEFGGLKTDQVKRLKELEQMSEDGSLEKMSKKEALMLQRELAKLQQSLGGIKDMDALPDAMFVIDVGFHKIAVTEAKKLGIPVVAVVDTNHSPEGIAHVIPGNDDSSRAIRLYARGTADSILEGRNVVIQEIIQGSDEFVEVAEEAK